MFDYPKGNPPKLTFPLMCWDVYAADALRRSRDTFRRDLKALSQLQQQYRWATDLSSTLQNPYEALILTDVHRQILWVNDGFERMTGYTPEDALGRNPSFLQGPKSDFHIKEELHGNLLARKESQHRIINYRKDGSEYLCALRIFPLADPDAAITHFLALESEVI